MTKTKQMKLVLLYAINELGGTATKDEVLNHINNKGYWQKNDSNDIRQNGRNELKWRNEFAFERSHLVKENCIDNSEYDEWRINDNGETRMYVLMNEMLLEPEENLKYCTRTFINKIRLAELVADEVEDCILIENMNQLSVLDDDTEVVLKEGPVVKAKPTKRANGRREYPRDPETAHNALKRAKYKCEISGTHQSFIRRTTQKTYLEPHHIIPLAYTDLYNVNLDREQNIAALCSNCHNKMHYGKYDEIKQMLDLLYEKRCEELNSILNKEISFKELCSLYGIK